MAAIVPNYKIVTTNTKRKPTTMTSRSGFKLPSKSNRAKEAYVKTLGFTPKDMPEFRTKPSGNIAARALDLLDRGRSGVANATLQSYNRSLDKHKAGKSTVQLPPFMNPLTYKDFWKGATGDINITGRSLVSRVADDPYIRKNMGASTQRLVDNNVFRSAAGFGLDVVGDPTNVLPIGAPLKVGGKILKGGSKAVGLTDNVIAPLVKRAKVAAPVQKVIKTLGGGRTQVWNSAVSNSDTAKAMFSEVGDLSKKMVTRVLKPRETTALKALIRGVSSRIGDAKGGELFIKNFDNTLRAGQEAVDRVIKTTGKVDVNKLDEYIRGIPQDVIDADYTAIAKMAKEPVEFMGKQLVKTGQLAQETLDENLNYMAKFYTGKGNKEVAKKISTSGGSRGLGVERGRLEEAISEPARVIEYLRENRVKLPEIKEIMRKYRREIGKFDPKDVTARNELARKLEPELRQVLGDNFSRFAYQQQKGAGLITDAPNVLANTLEQQGDIIAKTQLFEVAKPTIKSFADEAIAAQEGFKRIPKTPKYQDLAGQFVPDVIYDDIVGLVDMGSGQWRKLINAWKQIKLFAPLNFASPSRNFISDTVANSMVEGGPPIIKQFAVYIPKAIKEMAEGGPTYREALERGVFAGTWANQEARRTLGKAIGYEGAQGIGDIAMRGADALTSNKLWKGKEMYGSVSDLGKMVQILHQKKMGKTMDEAIAIANKATFDYSKMPVALRKYRDNFMPFMTYKYFAAQLLADTLMNRTGKITKLTHARRAVEGLTSDQANERDLPGYMKNNRPFYVRTPFKDSKDNPRYLDMSYIYPMGDIGETSGLDMMLGNPFFKSAAELGFNKNTFTGQPIVEEGMLPSDKAKARAKYLMQQFSPNSPLMPGTSGFRRMAQTIKGEESPAKVKSDARFTIPEVFGGIKLKEVNPQLQRKYNKYDVQEKERAINTQINRIKKDKKMSPEQKREKIKRLKEQLSNVKKS